MSEHTEQQKKSPAMGENLTETIKKLLSQLTAINPQVTYIQPEMLPDIDLYMDQVTTFMDTHLEGLKRYADDKILTKTMINNYAKNNLLPPPEKKKYSKDHMLLLTFIYYFKNMLSMNDIQCLLDPIKSQFFQSTSKDLRLEDIYREVFFTQTSIRDTIIDDIQSKFSLSRRAFENLTSAPEAEGDRQVTLQNFTFICMLCYDIFLKKQMVERIIDSIASAPADDEDKKKHKS